MVQDGLRNLLGCALCGGFAGELAEGPDAFRQWLVFVEHEQDDEACLQQVAEHRSRIFVRTRMIEVRVAAVAHEVVLGFFNGRKRDTVFCRLESDGKRCLPVERAAHLLICRKVALLSSRQESRARRRRPMSYC